METEREAAPHYPTVQEVQEYAEKAGLEVDAKRFVGINSAAGWLDGEGKPIRNWQLWLKGYVARARAENGRPDPKDLPDPRIEMFERLRAKYAREEAAGNDQS